MRVFSTLLLTTAALAATALPAAAAQVDAAVSIESQGRLAARGAAVTVPISVLCQRGATGSMSVQVTQNVRGELAIGERYLADLPCTGRYRTVEVTVVSRTKAFRPGIAFTSASLSAFLPPDSSNVVEKAREMMLVR